EVHEHILLNGRAEYLVAPMEHYAFPDIATFIEKHNRYSTWEAAACVKLHEQAVGTTLRATPFGTAVERKRWLKGLAMGAPFRPSLRFFYHYLWKRGFRDGYRGWVLCRLLAWRARLIRIGAPRCASVSNPLQALRSCHHGRYISRHIFPRSR